MIEKLTKLTLRYRFEISRRLLPFDMQIAMTEKLFERKIAYLLLITPGKLQICAIIKIHMRS